MLKPSELSDSDLLPPLQADEFLPSISRWARLGALLLIGLLAGGVGLAAVMRYNLTVPAIATVRPVAGLGIVQVTTGGTIQQVVVTENQPVKQGDVIAELSTVDQAQLSKLQTRRKRIRDYVQQYQTQVEQIDQQLQALNPQLEQQRDSLQQQRQGLLRQIRYDQASLQSIDQELSQFAIIVPTDGTIFQLQIRNPGQTVQPGDVVAQIVPAQGSFILKARVGVQDISQVEVGQPAQIRISAYPYPDYGVLSGTVQSIAPDAAVEQNSNAGTGAPYYELTIQLDRPYLTKGDRQYPLQPGMEARADIITGQETVMQSFLRKLRLWADV